MGRDPCCIGPTSISIPETRFQDKPVSKAGLVWRQTSVAVHPTRELEWMECSGAPQLLTQGYASRYYVSDGIAGVGIINPPRSGNPRLQLDIPGRE